MWHIARGSNVAWAGDLAAAAVHAAGTIPSAHCHSCHTPCCICLLLRDELAEKAKAEALAKLMKSAPAARRRPASAAAGGTRPAA